MSEKKIHTAIAKYIKIQYPNVIFTSESSGLRLSKGLSVQIKAQRSNHKHLDMIILEPRGEYHGLIIEIKKDISKVFKKNGELRKNEHVEAQKEMIDLFNSKGYKACFGFGFDHSVRIINDYLNTI